ncbi:MAG: molybdenum cofactor guanylyltransferase [Candidatus Bathyarchaeia archaeon]
MRAAIILAGGDSTRMKRDKGLMDLAGEPMVRRVVDGVSGAVDEVIVVVGTVEQHREYSRVLGGRAEILTDVYRDGSPLVGAITGFQRARGEYALITACDMPFVSPDVIRWLFTEAEGHDGATFEWPNGWIEPFFAIYPVEPSLRIARVLFEEKNMRLRMVLRRLPDVKYIPMDALRERDPELLTFFDVDTEEAIVEAEKIMEKMDGA